MPSIFAWLRRVYSLDTLDTRFTSSATPAHANTRPSKDARANVIAQGASPSLWRTPEFFVYYLFFIILVPLMFKTVIDVSKGVCRPEKMLLLEILTEDQRHRKPPRLLHILSPFIPRLDPWSSGGKCETLGAQPSTSTRPAPTDIIAPMPLGQLRCTI
jgi:hypothetical protein